VMIKIKEQFNAHKIQQVLEGSQRKDFQEYEAFILRKWKGHKYHFKRIYKDGSIDGFCYRNGTKEGIDIFSMYGKESRTSRDRVFKKLNDDLTDAINHANTNGFKLVNWYPVTNFTIATDHKHELAERCKKYWIGFKELDPASLVGLLNYEQQYDIAPYFFAVEAPEIPFSSNFNNNLPERILLRIAEYFNKPTTLRIEMLKDARNAIFKHAFINKPEEMNSRQLKKQIINKTKIPEEFIYSYKVIGNSIIPVENQDSWFFKDGDYFIIKNPNLYPVYCFCEAMLKKPETNDMSLALQYCYEMNNIPKNQVIQLELFQ
jgi:hypothetical protein